MTTVGQITRYLESIAPLSYQESYDNAGLLTGNPGQQVTGVLVALDAIEAVVDEAIERGCNVVVAHHPIIFRGLKKLNGKNYVERTIIKAIKHDIAIYAIHTNLDNVYYNGVNQQIADKLGLQDTRILQPSSSLYWLRVTVPEKYQEALCMELTTLGAEAISITRVSLPENNLSLQSKLEFKLPGGLKNTITAALNQLQDIEITDYALAVLENKDTTVGAGMIGNLAEPLSGKAFLERIKSSMAVTCIRYTAIPDKAIQKVALCGGAGSFLLSAAISAGADAFISGDFKYHEFFDADNKILVADIGHFESEQYTTELLAELLSKKFTNFAVHCVKTNTNPVNYFF